MNTFEENNQEGNIEQTYITIVSKKYLHIVPPLLTEARYIQI